VPDTIYPNYDQDAVELIRYLLHLHSVRADKIRHPLEILHYLVAVVQEQQVQMLHTVYRLLHMAENPWAVVDSDHAHPLVTHDVESWLDPNASEDKQVDINPIQILQVEMDRALHSDDLRFE
jgi:hypothetical protein